jgi:lysophospholipase L1-like esterase
MKKMLYTSLIINALGIAVFLFALQKIGSLSYIWSLVENRGQNLSNSRNHRITQFQVLPKKMGQIVMLGNSITAECQWAELLDNPKVLNRGISGDGTDHILARLQEIIELEPEKIFLLIGINDMLFHPKEFTVLNYEKILTGLRSALPKTQIFVQSVLPVHNYTRRIAIKNADIVTLNSEIKMLAQKFNLPYVELHSKFTDTKGNLNPDFSGDGIHLNGSGYKVFGEILKPYLLSVN